MKALKHQRSPASYRDFRRYNVVGTSGTGKTTFSAKLASILSLPHIQMDAIFWGPYWHWPSDDVFFPKLRKALESDGWVLDGNYTRTVPIKWAKVECVIWLDYSFPRTFIQAVLRAVGRAASGEELWPGTGNKETFRQSFFSSDSIILWTIRTYRRNRQKYEQMMQNCPFEQITFVRLRSPEEAARYLRDAQR